jgi:hypothetical protein
MLALILTMKELGIDVTKVDFHASDLVDWRRATDALQTALAGITGFGRLTI